MTYTQRNISGDNVVIFCHWVMAPQFAHMYKLFESSLYINNCIYLYEVGITWYNIKIVMRI